MLQRCVPPKSTVLLLSLAQSGIFAGIIFGWPAFSKMLEQGGVFLDDKCTAQQQSNQTLPNTGACLLTQRSSSAFVYTIASTLFIFASLPGGLLLDRFGPACAALLGGSMVSIGFALVASSPDHLIAPAFMLVGAGCSICYSTSLKTAFLFRQKVRTPIIAAINAFFDASALVPLALHTFSSALGSGASPSVRRAYVFYGLSVVSAVLFGLWAASWFFIRFELRASAAIAAEKQDATRDAQAKAQANARTVSHSAGLPPNYWIQNTPPNRWPLDKRPFGAQCKSPQLFLLSLWMCIAYVRCSFFLSSARALLQTLGDDEKETYMSAFLSMMPLSILIGPLFAIAIDRYGHTHVMYIISLLSALTFASALVPSLPFQVLTFSLHCITRAGMYPTAIGYLAKTFGDATLGASTGFMFCACGCANLLVYPLSLVANERFGGDVRPILALLAALPLLPQLFVVHRLAALKAGLWKFPQQWKGLMKDVRKSEMHRWGSARSCPVCMERMKWGTTRVIELSCTHVICAACATKMSGAGFRKCPICRHPHLLDPKLLKLRSEAWRTAYAGWRQGKVRGAAGEFSSIADRPSSSGKRGETIRGDASPLLHALDLASMVTLAKPTSEAWKLRKYLPIDFMDLHLPADALPIVTLGRSSKLADLERSASTLAPRLTEVRRVNVAAPSGELSPAGSFRRGKLASRARPLRDLEA